MADDNDDDESYFEELLEKRGETWLAKTLEKLGLKPPEPKDKQPATPTGEGGFTAFLNEALKEAKAETKTLRERLEAAWDLLTPEQRTQLRSPKNGNEGDRQTPKGKPAPKPASDPPEKPKRSGFLSRL